MIFYRIKHEIIENDDIINHKLFNIDVNLISKANLYLVNSPFLLNTTSRVFAKSRFEYCYVFKFNWSLSFPMNYCELCIFIDLYCRPVNAKTIT